MVSESTLKMAYEVVFGQKSNSTSYLCFSGPFIDEEELQQSDNETQEENGITSDGESSSCIIGNDSVAALQSNVFLLCRLKVLSILSPNQMEKLTALHHQKVSCQIYQQIMHHPFQRIQQWALPW